MRSGRGRGRGRGRGGMQKIPDLIQQADNEMDTVLFEADDSFEASPSPKRLRVR